MAIFNYSGIRSLLFEYSNNIRSPNSDRISNRITLFGTQLFEYSNNSNYSFKHWPFQFQIWLCYQHLCSKHLSHKLNQIYLKLFIVSVHKNFTLNVQRLPSQSKDQCAFQVVSSYCQISWNSIFIMTSNNLVLKNQTPHLTMKVTLKCFQFLILLT